MHRLLPVLLAVSWLMMASPAWAKPTGPSIFCQTYPTTPHCAGNSTSCEMCHTASYPPQWNAYGLEVATALATQNPDGYDFEQALPAALRALEEQDPDQDTIPTGEELGLGTFPGDPESVWFWPETVQETLTPSYQTGRFDYPFALRRVSILYCGHSPDYDAMQAMRSPDRSDEEKYGELHGQLEECLSSEYWRDVALPRLADWRIRPIYSVGPDATFIQLADYRWDYRLWSYILTGDRDARELLTADYHVQDGPDGSLTKVSQASGQASPPDKRAGMITTQWFVMANTMFSALPRTTAAQAYRAYLGYDISREQGIVPVASEPVDIDHKGVDAPACSICHSTLDPLAYAFATYNGLFEGATGGYDPGRPARRIPDWMDNQAYLLGEPVADLIAWARRAADSDDFARNLAQIFFEHALGRTPGPADHVEFERIWRALPEENYSANRLIHRLVDTLAFGAP